MGNTPSHSLRASGLPVSQIGPYALVARIGGGSMGNVYLARHVHLQRIVALKVLSPSSHSIPGAVARFRLEMQAIGALDHPHIVAATDAGEDDGSPYLVMEYVPGLNLARLLRLHGPLPVPEACELARQTALALVCLEQNGLVHRDVKPSNLLLGRDGRLRVLDLGLARLRDPACDSEPLTESGQVMGTGDFIAPEQGLASRDVDIRADIYSLGCTLYTLLAGRAPFADADHPTFYLKIRAHLEEPIPPIANHRPDLPDGLTRLLQHVLARDPAQRISPPAELARQLEPFAAGHDFARLFADIDDEPDTGSYHASTHDPGPTHDTPRLLSPRHRRGPSRRLLLGGGLAALAGILAYWKGSDSNPARLRPEPSSDPDRLEPAIWNDLLDRPPRVVLWPTDPGKGRWDHDRAGPTLWATSSGIAMLGLANVEGVGFDLEVTLSQNPWVGGVGVFFRCRDESSSRVANTWSDLLFLKRFDQHQRDGQVCLARGQLRRLRDRKRPPFETELKSVPLARPLNPAHRLALSVDAGGVSAIRWDDRPIAAELCDPQMEIPRRQGAQGQVGLLLQNSNAVVRSARIRVHVSAGGTS